MRSRTGISMLKLGAALAGLALLLAMAFSVILPRIPTWGATEEEVARTLPGDDLLPDPAVTMTHGIGVEVAPAELWPWIAQIGDVRGGFYSYTFIENLIVGRRMYVNADRIVPELQNPGIGEQLIEGMLEVLALLWFTFAQPAVWQRIILDILLIGGLYWIRRRQRRAAFTLF